MIKLSKSCIGEAEKNAVIGVLECEFLGMGNEVKQFEDDLSEFFSRNVVCTNSGTSALQLALQACNIGQGDEVLVPSITYVASFQAISATGAVPIACDVDYDTVTLDFRDAEKRITKNTKAVMPVHYSGGVGDLDAIYKFAKLKNLRVIEDAAHAFGSHYKGKLVGSFGDIVCFSFDGIKNITSGEGGCVVSTDMSILSQIKDARLLGVEKDSDKRYEGKRSWDYDVKSQGWRYHMSNIMAAIGIEQLKRFPEFSKKRRVIAKLYDHYFKDVKSVELLKHDYNEVVPHIYVVKIINCENKGLLRKQLLEQGIETGVHYFPNHKLSYFKQKSALGFSVTDKLFKELLSLPLHPDMSENDVKTIVTTVENFV